MKKLLVTLAAVLLSVSTFGQGTVFFSNRPSTGDAPVSRFDGTGAGAGWTAQLYLVSSAGTLTPLTPTTTFRTTSPAAAYFVNPIDVAVPNMAPGTQATLRFVVWETTAGSLQAAQGGAGWWAVAPSDVTVVLGGVNETTGAIIPTPELAGLQGFTIPEPSTIAFGILGAAALLLRRRC